jgi:hypothetical protein
MTRWRGMPCTGGPPAQPGTKTLRSRVLGNCEPWILSARDRSRFPRPVAHRLDSDIRPRRSSASRSSCKARVSPPCRGNAGRRTKSSNFRPMNVSAPMENPNRSDLRRYGAHMRTHLLGMGSLSMLDSRGCRRGKAWPTSGITGTVCDSRCALAPQISQRTPAACSHGSTPPILWGRCCIYCDNPRGIERTSPQFSAR